jgi:gas vesicle protein
LRSNRFEHFLIGLLCGAALGVIVGLLFAPQSGTRTRRLLAKRAHEIADAAKVAAERAGDIAGIMGERVDHYLGRDEEVAWRKVRELREGVQRYTQQAQPQ